MKKQKIKRAKNMLKITITEEDIPLIPDDGDDGIDEWEEEWEE